MTQRVWLPYDQLEEHDHGMWRRVPAPEQERYIEAARALMADPAKFLEAMMQVVDQWPNSVRAALTTPSLNARAYMGHAGCCLATGSPEDLTRLGWHRLTERQQDRANAAADDAIAAWRARHSPLRLWRDA